MSEENKYLQSTALCTSSRRRSPVCWHGSDGFSLRYPPPGFVVLTTGKNTAPYTHGPFTRYHALGIGIARAFENIITTADTNSSEDNNIIDSPTFEVAIVLGLGDQAGIKYPVRRSSPQ